MEIYRLIIKETAEKDFAKHKKAGNQAIIVKINKILDELRLHPFTGTGKPEALKHDLKGLWSRRINKKDRMIYEVNQAEVTILILSSIGHYDDK